MARKTDGEKIDELERRTTEVIAHLESTTKLLDRIDADHVKTATAGHDLRREFERELALVKRDIDELKKWKDDQKREREESTRRAWSFGPNIIGAIVNVSLSALVAYFVSRR